MGRLGVSSRRDVLHSLSGMAAGAWALGRAPRLLAAEPDPEVPNEIVAGILKARYGDRPIVRGQLALDMPAMAEDGRIVPVIIESDLPMRDDDYVTNLALIVDHNPDPLVAVFHLTPALGRVNVQTRIKMKRATWVRAIAETSRGRLWADYARVNVSINGCG